MIGAILIERVLTTTKLSSSSARVVLEALDLEASETGLRKVVRVVVPGASMGATLCSREGSPFFFNASIEMVLHEARCFRIVLHIDSMVGLVTATSKEKRSVQVAFYQESNKEKNKIIKGMVSRVFIRLNPIS